MLCLIRLQSICYLSFTVFDKAWPSNTHTYTFTHASWSSYNCGQFSAFLWVSLMFLNSVGPNISLQFLKSFLPLIFFLLNKVHETLFRIVLVVFFKLIGYYRWSGMRYLSLMLLSVVYRCSALMTCCLHCPKQQKL